MLSLLTDTRRIDRGATPPSAGAACACEGAVCLLGVVGRALCAAGVVGEADVTGDEAAEGAAALAVTAGPRVDDTDSRPPPLRLRSDGGRADLGEAKVPVTATESPAAAMAGGAKERALLDKDVEDVGLPLGFEERPEMYCSTNCCFACRAARRASSCFRFSARSIATMLQSRHPADKGHVKQLPARG